MVFSIVVGVGILFVAAMLFSCLIVGSRADDLNEEMERKYTELHSDDPDSNEVID